MKTITREDIEAAVAATIADIVTDFKAAPETDREAVIERLDEECDSLFGNLVQHGRIDKYDSDDLVETAQPCAAIIAYAKDRAWVEDDSGLWDGLTFGVLASIAYFSLRNVLHEALREAGHDSNDDYPFAVEEDETADA